VPFVKWRTRDGQYTVDVITLTGTSRNRDGEWFRVKQHGIHLADVRSVEELAAYLDLADLEEALGQVARCTAASTSRHRTPPHRVIAVVSSERISWPCRMFST
jgi:hypothetical protein